MTPKPAASYSLSDLQAKTGVGHYQITRSARDGAARLELDEHDIKACVLALKPTDFYKTMQSRTVPGAFHDVYKVRFRGRRLYVKLTHGVGHKAVVISFKRDEATQTERPE